jgi:hypothetical protein
MAKLKIYIPDSAFQSGGKFEKHADEKHAIQVPFVSVTPTIKVNFQPKYFEESQFQPATNKAYLADLDAIRQGLIVVEKAGVPQTPEQLIDIFKTYFQEL